MKRLLLILALILVISFGIAYWFGGIDVHFIAGYARSLFRKEATVSVVNPPGNVNTSPTKGAFRGFAQRTVVSGLAHPTRMAFEPGTNDMIVSEEGGTMLRIGNDGSRQVIASGFTETLGISFERPEFASARQAPRLIVASKSTVSLLSRQGDGTYGQRDDILIGLPSGRHQTDLALQGPDGKLYVANGSRSDRGETGIAPYEASVLQSTMEGDGLRVFSSGLRNPFAMQFVGNDLYVSDNGRDVPANGVPDELNLVQEGKSYGWPGCWGVKKGSNCEGTVSPVALLQEHSSADGFASYNADAFPPEYAGNLFIAEFGSNSRNPDIGKRVVRVILPAKAGELATVQDFATGFGNPIDVKVDPADGSLLVLDYGRGTVVRISAQYSTS